LTLTLILTLIVTLTDVLRHVTAAATACCPNTFGQCSVGRHRRPSWTTWRAAALHSRGASPRLAQHHEAAA